MGVFVNLVKITGRINYLLAFFRKLQPVVNRALPPVGWDIITLQPGHTTTVCAWLKTVLILKHPWHFTSMKKLFGDCTSRFFLWRAFSAAMLGWSRSTARGMF